MARRIRITATVVLEYDVVEADYEGRDPLLVDLKNYEDDPYLVLTDSNAKIKIGGDLFESP